STTYDYSPEGYMTQMASPAGTTSFGVDTRGNVIRKAMPGGRVDTFKYDLRDLQIEAAVDSAGFANKSTFAYDLNGNLTRRSIELKDNFDSRVSGGSKQSVSQPGQLVETFTYDILDRQTRVVTQGPGVS